MFLKHVSAVCMGLVLSSSVLAQSHDNVNPAEAFSNTLSPGGPLLVLGGALLDTRAGMITSTGTGGGGADSSSLQDTALGMNTFGIGVALATGYRVADDFTVPASGWTLSDVTVYAYQTGSTTTSTLDHLNFRIWDGDPRASTSNVVFGDPTTNRFSTTGFTNIYREQLSAPGATNRPIMGITASGLSINLPAGTYWLDYQIGGTLGSGPWAVPLTTLGQTTTGNGLQFDPTGSIWNDAADTGSSAVQGFPMTLGGSVNAVAGPARAVPANSTVFLLALLAGVLSLGLVIVRKN